MYNCLLWSFGAMSSIAGIVIMLVLYFVTVTSSSSNQIVLGTGWSLSNENASILIPGISLPSGVYSALENAGITESVLFAYNDVNLRWIAMDNWTYSFSFSISEFPEETFSSKYIMLTMHGVDTVAQVFINGEALKSTSGLTELNNMFVRYRFDVKHIISDCEEKCTLAVVFQSPVIAARSLAQHYPITPPKCPPNVYNGECHMNFLRKMQASFSWDWGPAVPSSGLWRPVILEYYNSVLIRDITVKLEEDDTYNRWNIDLMIYMEAGKGVNDIHGNLTVTLVDFLVEYSMPVNKKTDERGELALSVSLFVDKDKVELWWPNGYGHQKLYVVQVIFDPLDFSQDQRSNNVHMRQDQVYKSIKIGFRTVELVQEPIDKGLSFYFKINGVPIFMKGTNWIPASILPEKTFNAQKIRKLLSAVKDSHMNMIRVWGGGVYEDDRFYELADIYGILIWHDLMFACAMYPVFEDFLTSVREEVRQNVRRIQSHPSVAIWAANNENEVALVQNWYGTSSDRERFEKEYRKLYIDVIKKEVEEVDHWRECLSSSPSNGRQTEVDGWISSDPQDWHYGDIHYYNYALDGWDSTIYPNPRFASEYGFQSIPSLRALESILPSGENISQMLNHRQHSPLRNIPMKVLIKRHLPLKNITEDPREFLEVFVYFSQVSQAMTVKTETEVYRANRNSAMNTMGALYWQLNDVWVAPSWSSIEFNGNYKILQYWVQQFMAPLHIIPLVDELKNLRIYIVRDSLGSPQDLTVKLRLHRWSGFDVKLEKSWNISVPENSVMLLPTLKFTDIFGNEDMVKESFLYFLLQDNISDKVISTNFIFPEKLKDAQGIIDPHIDVVVASNRCSFSVSQISLEVKARAPAVFVYLQIYNQDIKTYTLSKNGYIQLEPIQMIRLEFENENCEIVLPSRDIRILTINDYLKKTSQ